MDACLPAGTISEPGDQDVGVGIPGQEANLKKQETGSPDGGAAAVPRQDVPGNDRLNLKQKESAQEDRENEGWHRGNGAGKRKRGGGKSVG